MMNYYEMLGLPCDGKAVDDIRLIQTTLKQWELSKTAALNKETQEAKRKVLRSELAELSDMQRLLKDEFLRKQHADALKASRLTQVDLLISIMEENCAEKRMISTARLSTIAAAIGLLTATVQEKFVGAGYEVLYPQPAKTNDFLLDKRTTEKIDENLALIRNYVLNNENEPLRELCDVKNLYEYIAVMDGMGVRDAAEYELMATERLALRFGYHMMNHMRLTQPTVWFKNVEVIAKTQILKDDQQRVKYNNWLKLQELSPLLELLVMLPVTIKLEESFAEACIKRIRAFFIDEEQAIAIYNKYGEMPLDSQYKRT